MKHLGQTQDEEGKPGKAKVHFPGTGFKLDVLTGVGHYGRFVSVKRIEVKMGFWSQEAAEEWINELQKFAGPVAHEFVSPYGGEGKLKFVLEGVSLDRLQMNASNRRNTIPTYEWNDPNHPFIRAA